MAQKARLFKLGFRFDLDGPASWVRDEFMSFRSVTFRASFDPRRKGWLRPVMRLEARHLSSKDFSGKELRPFDQQWWLDLTSITAGIGGPALPLPDPGPEGTLRSGRPCVGSATAKWSVHAGLVACEAYTNRLEHVARIEIMGPLEI
jgi:hypothetical protein